jgi:hypothetical protein
MFVRLTKAASTLLALVWPCCTHLLCQKQKHESHTLLACGGSSWEESGFQISFSLILSFLTEIRKFCEIYEISKIKFKNVGQIQSLAIKLI